MTTRPAAPEMVRLTAARYAPRRAFEDGQDVMAGEIGCLMKDLMDSGASDTVIVEAVQETVIARLEAGLPQDEWFTPPPPGPGAADSPGGTPA